MFYLKWKPQGNVPQNSQYPSQAKTNGWSQPQQSKQPPIPFKPNGTSIEMASKTQKLVAVQKQKLSEMNKRYTPLLATLQTLDANKRSVES